MTRWGRILVALLLGATLAACTPGYVPFLDPAPPEVVTDPPPTQVAEALRFGSLAPLPPDARVVALEHQTYRDEWITMAIRMPTGAVEPYLVASGLGPFDEFSPTAGETVYDTILPSSALGPRPDYVVDTGVFREAATESFGEGDALLHVWLSTI